LSEYGLLMVLRSGDCRPGSQGERIGQGAQDGGGSKDDGGAKEEILVVTMREEAYYTQREGMDATERMDVWLL
jgi:hypothetical protein